MKRITQQNLILVLASLLTLQAEAVSSIPDQRPRPEEFASFSLYLQALFDHQRMQGSLSGQTVTKSLASIPQNESVDQAIANAGKNTGHVDTSSRPRSTFKSFALAQISPQDMSQSNIADVLGIFGDHGLEQTPTTGLRMRADSDIHLTPDVDLRLAGDINDAKRQEVSNSIIQSFSGYIVLPEGEAYTSASVTKSTQGDHGLDLTLSTRLRTNVYMIDRDGIPGSSFAGAGALAIQPLSLEFQDITSHITASKDRQNSDLIRIQTGSPNAITLDLSGSQIGAADAPNNVGTLALSSASLGRINYFAKFGPNSIVSIAPGMKMDIKISKPDGMRAPLATVNGSISSIHVGDLRLLGQSNGGSDDENTALRIGSIGISDLDISNLRLFINNQTIIIDMGPSAKDMALSLERISIGPNPESSIVGDLYMSHIGVSGARISIAAH